MRFVVIFTPEADHFYLIKLRQKFIQHQKQLLFILYNQYHMKNHILLLATFFLLFLFVFAEQPYNKVIHHTDPQAKCLDGSPALLYIHEGSQKDKFIIYFVGGGLCSGQRINETIEDCYQRSKTELGSSTNWPQQISGESLGYMSTNPLKTKFANWTKLIFVYCDGSLHQGYRKQAIRYKGVDLYFRGGAITRSHFKWLLQKHDFAKAKEVVITGLSAGGIATYLWSNYARKIVNSPQVVVSIPDSGIFILFQTYQHEPILQNMVMNMYQLANTDEKTPLSLCNDAFPQQSWKCLFFQFSYPFFQPKTLVINSQYDAFSLAVTLSMKCLTNGKECVTLAKCNTDEMAYIQNYRSKFLSIMTEFLKNTNNSGWLISCSSHGYASNRYYNDNKEEVPHGSGNTVKKTIDQFVFERKRVLNIDMFPWPGNTPCAF